MITKDHRGFRGYADIEDAYGANVRVKESSACVVEGDAYDDPRGYVWIFIEGGSLSSNKGSAHLTADQAKKIRDALSAWLAGK